MVVKSAHFSCSHYTKELKYFLGTDKHSLPFVLEVPEAPKRGKNNSINIIILPFPLR